MDFHNLFDRPLPFGEEANVRTFITVEGNNVILKDTEVKLLRRTNSYYLNLLPEF